MMPAFQDFATKEVVDQAVGPIGRYARPEEQAWPLVMLGSPRLSYVAGEVLAVDGGFQGARYTGRHQAGWADLINEGLRGGPMNKDDLILVSVDDHVVEPPDVFDNHLPAKYREVAPKLKERDDGTLAWYYYEHEITNVGLNAVAGRPREEYGIEPTRLDEMRRGCWDVDERIKDMNAGGVLGSLCFPSMPGFSGRIFASAKDDDIAGAMVRAYNDWHVHEWCGKHPGRFIPLGVPMIWSAEQTAAEVHRLADLGCHADHLPGEPGAARPAVAARPVLGSVLAGLRGARHRHLHAHRLVVAAGDDHARRAGRRADHAAADDDRAGRRRPGVEPGAQGVPRHQDRACRRAGSAGCRTSSTASSAPTTCTTTGPVRTSGT